MVKIGQELIVRTGIAVCSQKLEGREYEKESEKLMFKTRDNGTTIPGIWRGKRRKGSEHGSMGRQSEIRPICS